MEREKPPADLVMISADYPFPCVCPWHGAQLQAEYTSGRSPCGCSWVYGDDGLLHSVAQEDAGDVAESA